MSTPLNFFPCRVSRGARSRTSGLILTLALAFLLFPSPSSAATIGVPSNYLTLSSGLVGYWPLDGKNTNWSTGQTLDLSGQGNTGQLINMSTTTSPVAGKIGQALNFNGSNSYVSTSLSSLGTMTRGTVSLWVKRARDGPSEIVEEIDVSKASFEGFNTLSFWVNNDCQTSATSMTLNKWYHLAGTWDGTSARVYVNGVLANTTVCTSAPTMGTLIIGARSGGYLPLLGSTDDVRIYNRALSPTEVQALYNIGAANVAHSNTIALSSGLVGYWTFDGGTTHWDTGKVDDVSGHGNTGQLINMSTPTNGRDHKRGNVNNTIGLRPHRAPPPGASVKPCGGSVVYLDTSMVLSDPRH
jgi:hypothetical protein